MSVRRRPAVARRPRGAPARPAPPAHSARSARSAAALLGLALAASCSGEAPGAVAGPEGAATATATGERVAEALALRDDERIAPLLAPCPEGGVYTRDTSDMTTILVEKLETGQSLPMRRAKEALSEAGAGVVPALARMINRHFADPMGFAHVENALQVLTRNRAPEAREAILRCLEHPNSAIRSQAVRSLSRHHARPEDYDRLRDRLDVEDLDMHPTIAAALFASDRARAEDELLGWLRDGRWTHLWAVTVPELLTSERPSTWSAASELWPDARSDVQAALAAVAARGGDEAALAHLRGELVADDPLRRTFAVRAAAAAGFGRELGPTLLADPSPPLRALAAQAVGALEPDEETRAWLLQSLEDESPEVRLGSMKLLVERGEPGVDDRLLSLLDGNRDALQDAVTVLQDVLEARPDLAPRALERLLARDAAVAHRPLDERLAGLQAIGILPLEGAARHLRELGLAAPGETVQGMRAHRRLLIAASNTGVPGRTWLAAQLAGERDLLRRVDLIWTVSTVRDELARGFLLDLVEDPETSRYELLFAAERLVLVGPPRIVAPRLKRVALRVDDAEVRPALNCLLWSWY